jgi:hydroxymethylpyrimidine/phosphomethylpyrimidine kinase
VLDPVMAATSGDPLLEPDAIAAIVEQLVPLATLLTPNLDEVALLIGERPENADGMERAARRLVTELGSRAVLVKGGHLAGDELVDVLIDGTRVRRYVHPRVRTMSTHGTGCTLSAAVAALLARGESLERAVEGALDYVARAIARAPALGGGHGPLEHSA